MYYTFKCTYCRRAFYTYDRNRHNAAIVLYRTVKKHLIDYNEDDKEHEMDDGEQEDSNQIYAEMTESAEPPVGGIKATPLSAESVLPPKQEANPIPKHTSGSPTSSSPKPAESPVAHPSHSNAVAFKISIILLLLLMIIILGCIIFIPGFADNIALFFPR